MRGVVTAVFMLTAVSVGCGSPTSPTPPPGPAGPVVNIAGSWSGTLESANFPVHTITMTVVQGGNCVDGVWKSSPEAWTGAISGYAGTDSFTGQISVEFVTDRGERCSGVGNVSGHVGDDSLRWTGTGFTAVGQCGSALPQSIGVSLRRT